MILCEDHRKKHDISLTFYFNVILWLKRKSEESKVSYRGIVDEVLKQYFNIKTGTISLKLWNFDDMGLVNNEFYMKCWILKSTLL